MTRRLFPRRRPGPTIGLMAARSKIIATAAEVVLDKRIRGDEAKRAAVVERVGGSPEDRAAAEFWCAALLGVAEEMTKAGLDGRGMVETVLLANRHLVAM